ncbi:MAG: efflux RND transporter permease subunit, partial [Rikenellaceae bacterium]|nr:efflux RND transporter permease subunit [Rikenellaceae bacterium]
EGISSAIITSTLVFMAVFIPVSMMGGTSGIFYTQFGITMAVAVGISALNALTLSPALCAVLMKPYIDADGNEKNSFSDRFRRTFNTSFHALVNRYKYGVLFFIRRRWLTWTTAILLLSALVLLVMHTKTGLIPDEDMGTIMVNVTMPPGSSLHNTDRVMQEVYERIADMEQIHLLSSVSGYGLLAGEGVSNGMMILKLKNWSQRKNPEDAVQALLNEIHRRTAEVKDAQVFALAPPMITGYGSTNGFEMHLQDRNDGDIHAFFELTRQFIDRLNRRLEIGMAYSTFNPSFPQYMVDMDAAKCKRAGVSPATVLSTIAGYYGGTYVSNINRFSHVYRVMLQADPQYRIDPASLERTFVRMEGGQMAPLSQYVSLTKIYGPQTLSRFNMYNSIAVNGVAASGYSSGDAIRAIAEVAAETLPRGYSYEFSGITREENDTANRSLIVFGICIVLIYLILCAFYESFVMPIAIIISVPCELTGSFLFAQLFHLENNIYLQTGVIMLIGLLAKTAILITDYAITRRKAGMTLTQAAIGAAKVRLRPILMTALTMIFGMLPLMFASGVGANGNSSLGTGAVGGMLIGTLVLLFLVPALFVIFQWMQERLRPLEFEQPDWAVNAEIQEVEKLKKQKEEK